MYDTAARTAVLFLSAEAGRGYGYHSGTCQILQPREV